MQVTVLLPIIAFVALYVAVLKGGTGWRDRLVTASVLYGVLLAVGTELLGAFQSFNQTGVSALWCVVTVSSAIVAFARRKEISYFWQEWRTSAGAWLQSIKGEPAVLFCALLVCVLLSITFVVAIVSPPNTWDSMTYHMSRVMHWIARGDVDFYQTAIRRQLHMPPLAEYAIAHLQLLSSTDRLANLVQWFCSLGTLAVVSLIARTLSVTKPFQPMAEVLAPCLVLSIPTFVLQIPSTQNDIAVGFWLCAAFYLCLKLATIFDTEAAAGSTSSGAQKEMPAWLPIAVQLSFAAALAALTKGSAHLVLLPLAMWFAIHLIRGHRLKVLLALGALSIVALLMIDGPFFLRNYGLYGSPLGSGVEDGAGAKYVNQMLTPAVLFSGITRNVALELAVPNEYVNAAITLSVIALHKLFGLDPSDPNTTWWILKFGIQTRPFNEVMAGNPIQFLLAVAAVILTLTKSQLRARPYLLPYSLCTTSSFLLFCFLLRWHPYMTRLHLPMLMLAMPLVTAVFLDFMKPRRAAAISAVLLALALPYALFSQERPLLGSHTIFSLPREHQYFMDRPEIAQPYLDAAAAVRQSGCNRIGLVADWDSWEYPMWVLINEETGTISGEKVVLEHVSVENISSKLMPAAGPHCGYLVIDRVLPAELATRCVKRFESGPVRFYTVASTAVPPEKVTAPPTKAD